MASDIEWTDETWNPTTGCTPVSAGCLNCYAGGVFDHWRIVGAPCKEPEAHKRLADAIANARQADAEQLRAKTDTKESSDDQ